MVRERVIVLNIWVWMGVSGTVVSFCGVSSVGSGVAGGVADWAVSRRAANL